MDPDNWQVLNCASAIHRRWGAAMLEAQRDAEPALDEAIQNAEAGLRLRPSDTQLLNNLGTALRYKAGSGSYAKQKEELAKQREGLGNPLAGSGLILALATLAAWLLYR